MDRNKRPQQKFFKALNEFMDWQDIVFTQATALSKAHHLEEEVGELLTELEIPGSDSRMQLLKEYADCFVLLFASAKKAGLNLSDITHAIKTKLEINKNRKWSAPDANGVVRHIKEDRDGTE